MKQFGKSLCRSLSFHEARVQNILRRRKGSKEFCLVLVEYLVGNVCLGRRVSAAVFLACGENSISSCNCASRHSDFEFGQCRFGNLQGGRANVFLTVQGTILQIAGQLVLYIENGSARV